MPPSFSRWERVRELVPRCPRFVVVIPERDEVVVLVVGRHLGGVREPLEREVDPASVVAEVLLDVIGHIMEKQPRHVVVPPRSKRERLVTTTVV